jgi:thiamine biosynthesis lipoprotein
MLKQTRLIMGMPITVQIAQQGNFPDALNKIFDYFIRVDEKFSTYKPNSEISKINRKEIAPEAASAEMREIFKLAEETKLQTQGYFDILTPSGKYDPSGLVKGWAIFQAALLLKNLGFEDFFIDAGGDVQALRNYNAEPWTLGIRNPFNRSQIIKTLNIRNEGVATSGTYIRGQHIYNPHHPAQPLTEIVSLTVIAKNVYEADRFATAAFAMGKHGIYFLEKLDELEGYMIDKNGIATETTGFARYVKTN